MRKDSRVVGRYCDMSVLDGEGDGRDDAKQSRQRGLGACGALVVVLESDDKGVVAAIGVVDAKCPDMFRAAQLSGIGGAKVEAVVGGGTVTVAFGIIIKGGAPYLVFCAGHGERLPCRVAP